MVSEKTISLRDVRSTHSFADAKTCGANCYFNFSSARDFGNKGLFSYFHFIYFVALLQIKLSDKECYTAYHYSHNLNSTQY